jgi:hypothetical protein
MNPQEMQRRIATLEELVDRWLNSSEGCYGVEGDEEPPADCPCIYCTSIRVLEGDAA